MGKYLLGIDNGGTMTKAAIFGIDGSEVAVSSQKTPIIAVKEDYAERDMLKLWETTAGVIKDVIQKSGIDGKEIIAVGCTGHGKGLYLWGKDDKPAYNAIASTDNRAVDYIRKWDLEGISDKASEKTFQHVRACQPVALLAWLKDNEPAVYANIRWIFEAKDFIRFMLTGQAFAEATDYSGTSLMNLATSDFDIDLLKLFGIPEISGCLPPIRQSNDVCGYITESVARQTGLSEGTAVCGGMFDIDSCAIAMDVSDEEKLCVITGTWSINEYISKSPVTESKTTLNSLFCIPGYYLIEESSPTSAGNLEWLIDILNSPGGGKSLYKEIDDAVMAVPIEESNIVFVPFLYGSNDAMLDSASFIGLKNHHKKEHLYRAVFEGVAFSHKVHIDRLLESRSAPNAIRLAGGVVNSKVWVQIFADVLGMTIEVVNIKELGTLGCAMAAAVSVGEFTDYKQAAAEMVKISYVVEPKFENSKKYDKKFLKYKKAVELLGDL
ncbi:MAG: FGGY-family carbohydrate kinase [Saccharofermentanales bacterium]